jgi:HK97 family phage prohead protease
MEVLKMENRMQTVTRAYNFELRAENNEAHGDHIVGRPIVYDSKTNLGYFNEIIERGALDNADLKDVRFLVNHNTDMIPLARSRNNNSNSTMQMSVDDEGMLIRVNLDTENNSDAKNLYSAIKRGDITGMSFMFSIDSEEWDDLESEHPTRRIKEIGRVLEVSAVTFPAYDATEISARDKEALDNAKAALESARSQSLENDADMLELEKAKLRNKFF